MPNVNVGKPVRVTIEWDDKVWVTEGTFREATLETDVGYYDTPDGEMIVPERRHFRLHLIAPATGARRIEG